MPPAPWKCCDALWQLVGGAQPPHPSGVGADILLHPPEVLKGMVNTLVKCQVATCLQGKHILHGAEDVA
jgi:hypothetical protein